MAKESSAERVSPITRANYSGSAINGEGDATYDPLAALASLVGNIENDANIANAPAVEDPAVDLESELIQDFENLDTYGQNQPTDLNDLENELSFALNAGLPIDGAQNHVPDASPEFPPQASAESIASESVLQSFESLHLAFGAERQSGEFPSAPTNELLAMPVDTQLSPTHESVPVSPQIVAKDITTPPIEQFEQGLPVENTAAMQYSPVNDELLSETITPVVGSEFDPVIPYSAPSSQSIPTPVEVSNEAQTQSEEALTAEFEAAMSGSAAELFGQPQTADIAATTEVVAPPVAEQYQAENPFGTLEEAAVMPSVSTPFDHQVDDALSDILNTQPPADSELGWSGDLAGELEHIVGLTKPADVTFPDAEPQIAMPPSDPALEEILPIKPDPYVGETGLPQTYIDDPAVHQEPVTQTDFSAFEQELAEQLNPVDGDDDLVSIPDAPEFAEEPAKKRGGMGVAAIVLGLAVVVTGGAFSWNYFSNDGGNAAVPTILASSDPVKIKPKNPGGVKVPNQDQVVYEQVNGKSVEKTSQERLASGVETSIRVVTADATPPIVQPLPIVNSGAVAAKSSARISASDTVLVRTETAIIRPRKVRTVVVRPDGTIVAAQSAESPKKTAKAVEPIKVASTNKIQNFAQPVAISTKGGPAKMSPLVVMPLLTSANDTSLGSARSVIPAQTIKIVPTKPTQVGLDKLRTVSAPTEKPVATPVEIIAPRKVKIQPIKKVAVKKKAKPVKLASVSAGGYVMQISSQRSAEAAQTSYNRLIKRFGSILGGKGVDIRRFKLKDKGIYYRVRIPVGSKKSAINLCTRYKSAGGSCFVTR